VDNTGAAIGRPVTAMDTANYFGSAPSLTLAKSASPTTVTAAGDVITYTFHVTNTGNVTLSTITVDETAFSGTGIPPSASCPTAPLPPGQSIDCTGTYIVTQADLDAGVDIANAATATGTPPGNLTPPVSAPSDATVAVTQSPALTIAKSASPATVTAAGQMVTFTFHVTNTGNVTLSTITIKEGAFSGIGALSMPTCAAGAASLAPGHSVDCTATYTVTQADIDRGSITNTATATGTPPGNLQPPDSPPSSATLPITQNPAITLVKSANVQNFTAAGTVVTYSYKVTNTGNVTLTGVKVTDPMPGLSAITCPSTTLPPAASMTCTATYRTTQADVARGSIKNVATASAVDPDGVPMLSASSAVLIQGVPTAPQSPITRVTVPVTG
jgi:uncharacterized repeat protein (TIGR01451 family)